MSFEDRCCTIIDPPHSDGTEICEHIGDEHSYNEELGWFGACKIASCPCGDYTEGEEATDDDA